MRTPWTVIAGLLVCGLAMAAASSTVWADHAAGSDPTKLLADLASQDAAVRAQAVVSIGELGPEAKPLVPALVARLQDDDPLVQAQAAVALAKLDAAWEAALPALLRANRDSDGRLRAVAKDAFSQIGPGTHAAMPWILDSFRAGPSYGRPSQAKAEQVLSQSGLQVVPALLEALAVDLDVPVLPGDTPYPEPGNNARLQSLAAAVLAKLGPPAVPTLIEMLKQDAVALRLVAADALRRLGTEAQPAVPDLKLAVDERDDELRQKAMSALGEIARTTPDLTAFLVTMTEHRDPNVRQLAVVALRDAGPKESVVPALTTALDDPVTLVRISAADALSRVEPSSEPLFAMLLAELQNRQAATQQQVLQILGRTRKLPREPAIAAVTEACRDPQPSVRKEALATLAALGPDRPVLLPVFRAALEDSDHSVRAKAAGCLWDIGERQAALTAVLPILGTEGRSINSEARQVLQRLRPEDADLVPTLVAALNDGDTARRQMILEALFRTGPAAAKAVPVLLPLLRDRNLRYQVTKILRNCGPEAQKLVVPVMLEMLKSGTAQERLEAVSLLRQTGVTTPDAKAVVPVLIDLLNDADTNVRNTAAGALALYGTEAKAAVPLLAEMLKRNEPAPIYAAANALGFMGPDAVPPLVEAAERLQSLPSWESPEARALTAAIPALGRLGPAAQSGAPTLATLAAAGDQSVRQASLDALSQIGAAAVPVLTVALNDDQPEVRRSAAETLGRIGVADGPVVRMLVEKLADPDPRVRLESALALCRLDVTKTDAAAVVLVEALRDTNPQTRWKAAEALSLMPDHAEKAAPVVIESLKSGETTQVYQAISILRRIGPQSKTAVPVLTELLRAKPDVNPTIICQALGGLGTEGMDALVRLVESGDDRVRTPAASALSQVRPVDTTRLLLLAQHENPHLRKAALSGLGNALPMSAETIAAVIACLQDKDENVCDAAVQALRMTGRRADAAAAPLMDLFHRYRDSDAARRDSVVTALGWVGPAAKPAVPLLTDLLNASPPGTTRVKVAEALYHIDPQGQPGALPLFQLLNDPDGAVAREASRVLQQAGPPPRAAQPELTKALKHPVPDVRVTAASLLGRLGVETDAVIEVLTAALKEPDRTLRMRVAVAVFNLGPAAKPLAAALTECLQDRMDNNVGTYLTALQRIGVPNEELLPPVVEVLGRPSYVPQQALDFLWELGPAAKSAVPALTKFVEGAQASNRDHAAAVLYRLDPTTQPLVTPVLIAAVRRPNSYPRSQVVAALGEIGKAEPAARSALHATLKHAVLDVRVAAAAALWKAEGQPQPLVPVLAEACSASPSVSTETVRTAVTTLGAIGAAAKDAVPRLVELMNHASSSDIQQLATEALLNINKDSAPKATRPEGTPN